MKSTASRVLFTRLLPQTGLTLVELLVGIAVSSLVASASLIAVYGILTYSRQANDTQLAVAQVRAAEHWMSRDALSAQTVVLGVNSGFPLTLSWTAIDGDNIQITYSLIDVPSSSLKRIQRDYSDTGDPDSSLVVCEYIDSSLSSCTQSTSEALSVTLAATVGVHTETRSFDVKMRPETS